MHPDRAAQAATDAAARAAANERLREQKLASAVELLGMEPEGARRQIFNRAVAGIPRDPHARYRLPRLEVTACDRVGDNLVRIALANGRVFYGHRSEQAEYVMHFLLRSALPEAITGDAYKLATDIHSRYIEGTLPWYFRGEPGGVYVEGGCFTGLKAIKWNDALDEGARVIGVEIGGANHEILSTNIEANGLEGSMTAVHAGLWSETRDGIQRHSFSTRRFLESTDRWAEQLVYEEKVRLLTIDALLDEQGVDVAEYVNIQVNGAEIKVLEGVADLDRMKVIDVAAYYSQDGVRNVDVVREMLASRGCRILAESRAGRLAVATPKYIDEVLARRGSRAQRA